jgi:hypothetical protein
MWPFSPKPKKPPEEPAPAAAPAAHPAPAPHRARTAAEVLRQLDAEAAAKPRAGRPDPVLGQTLLAEGPITHEFLKKQLAVGGKSDTYLGRILAETAAPTEADLFDLLARGYTVPEVDLKQCKVNVAAARSVPRDIALKYKIVPIDRVGDLLCVAFAEKLNPNAIEAIRRATGLRVKALRCPPHHILMLLRRLYATGASAPAAQAVAAVPMSDDEFTRATSGAARAEAHWESLHTSRGPLRAVRVGRK